MSTAAYENIPRERAANVRPDSVAMLSSFPERNTSQRPASLHLITRTLMFIQRRQKQCIRKDAHKMWNDDFCVSYIQSHRLLGPGLLHLVVHDGVVDAQPAKDHKCLKKTRRMQ